MQNEEIKLEEKLDIDANSSSWEHFFFLFKFDLVNMSCKPDQMIR